MSDSEDRLNEGHHDRVDLLQPDGGALSEVGGEEIYTAVRGAVKDALLDVIGLLLQLGIGLALLFIGVMTLIQLDSAIGAAFGIALLLTGIAVAVPVLRLVQPIRI